MLDIPEVFQMLIWLILVGVQLLIPLALLILLIVWLTNKRRRDEEMIARIVELRQTLDRIREQLVHDSDAN